MPVDCAASVCFLWVLVVVPWAVWRVIAWQAGRVRDAAARRRSAVEARREAELRRAREQHAAQVRDQERRDRRRREDARSRCEALYHRHAPEIGARFTRYSFDDYARKYMGDGRDPDEVEERAAQLQAIILDHLERVRPAPTFRSLGDIAAWFEEQKRQLAALPDDRLRETMLARLKARYTELTTEFLEGLQA